MPEGSQAENQLLAKLPPMDFQLLAGSAERVNIPVREVLCEPGKPLHFAYFPTSSMLSSIIVLSGGTTVEAATIGNEGMAGVGLLINERASPHRVIQQVRGETIAVPVDRFREALTASPALRELLQRYTFTLLLQGGQNAACNLHHRIEARMCRWLLQTSDRAGRTEFDITQDFLSEMLGVSRQTVNATARALQEQGLIEYRRGYVALPERSRLEKAACECYAIYNDIYYRYMKIRLRKSS